VECMAVVMLLGLLSAAIQWGRGLWAFYRQYTQTAIHAASVAALTIFGLLVFIDPLFAGVAIAAYLCPPLVLYLLGVDVGAEPSDVERTDEQGAVDRQERTETSAAETDTEPPDAGRNDETNSDRNNRNSDRGDGDSDTDSDNGDSDTDSDNGDSDTDSDNGDSDTDSNDGDSDTDSDDGDSDTDSDDGDSDSDRDGRDSDTDSDS